MARAVRLIRPLERSIFAGHPWIYRDALAAFEARPGELVDVFDKRGRLLAKGYVDAGPIAVRVLTTRPKDQLGPALFAQRIQTAFALRAQALGTDTDAYRLLHGEGDRVPGLVCDRYGSYAVVKLDGEGAQALRPLWLEPLQEALQALGVVGALVRGSRKQNVEPELLFGTPPPRELRVRERGMRLLVNPWEGQKTGLFLDHRESRARVRSLARGLDVLNLYGYTGGFSVAAGLGGASAVTTVDLAKPAIELAERTFASNDLDPAQHQAIAEDVPEFLKRIAQSEQRYDLVIADPPNFAPNQAALSAALESYAALHAACLSLLPAHGGLYLAASCSSHALVPVHVQA
ncbi:MAG TPA: class I SAM-dependent rRNA methyltransferase, partial [Polyangiales bacterium]